MRAVSRVSPRNLAVVWNATSDPVDLEIDPDGRIHPIRREEPAAPQRIRPQREVSFSVPPLRWD